MRWPCTRHAHILRTLYTRHAHTVYMYHAYTKQAALAAKRSEPKLAATRKVATVGATQTPTAASTAVGKEAAAQAAAAKQAEKLAAAAQARAEKQAAAQAAVAERVAAKAAAAKAAKAAVADKAPAKVAAAKKAVATAATATASKAAAVPKAAAAPSAAAAPAAALAKPNTPVEASDVSVQVRQGSIDLKAKRLPSSVGVTLPVIGSVRINLAISVEKTTAAEAAAADVVVTIPKDLIKAAKLAAGGDAGVVLDVPGFLAGRFDLELSTPRAGEADVVLTSKNIPKLPLQKTEGLGRFCYNCGNGNEQSEWYFARNLGNGVEFYGNARTGVSQFELPKEF